MMNNGSLDVQIRNLTFGTKEVSVCLEPRLYMSGLCEWQIYVGIMAVYMQVISKFAIKVYITWQRLILMIRFSWR